MFFATSRLGSRKHQAHSGHHAHLPIADVTDELVHPSRLLLTEEVILGICMVITGLLYAFAQMPATMLDTAAASRSLMRQSVASFVPNAVTQPPAAGQPLIEAAGPMFTAIRQATDLENRGDFGTDTLAAWQTAAAAAGDLTFTPITTSSGTLRLWMLTAERERANAIEARLEAMLAPQRLGLQQLRRLQLTPAQQAALVIPTEQRSAAEAEAAEAAEKILEVSWLDTAEVLAEPARSEAVGLCRLLADAEANAAAIARCREVINFDHWRAIAEFSSTSAGLRARAALARAAQAIASGEPEAAQAAYEEGLTAWQQRLLASRELADDPAICEALSQHVDDYRSLMADLGLPFDNAFNASSLLGGQPAL